MGIDPVQGVKADDFSFEKGSSSLEADAVAQGLGQDPAADDGD